MLAGDPNRRTLDLSDPAQDAIRYTCLGGNLTETHGMTATDELELMTQSSRSQCAQAVYEPKHFSHIAGMSPHISKAPAYLKGMGFTLGSRGPSMLPTEKDLTI
jgi:hypothetical protein